ncbi:hypothetical protein V5799_008700 [Amblyomma americanum]|uniref:Uncharacterized protein n=1 Tax=Amblyomma americanum TaxID=6943 RepID=A0AAQ4FD81_AMBAM
MTTGKRDSKAVRFLAGTACTFGFNGVYMMLSCMMSATSAYYLPRLFYLQRSGDNTECTCPHDTRMTTEEYGLLSTIRQSALPSAEQL